MALIYKIACDITDKVYIGQTRQILKERIRKHLVSVRIGSKYAIHNAIRKYGWSNFKVEVLEDNISLENLNEREIFWTNKFNALAPNGYVLKTGNGNNQIITEEVRKKLSGKNNHNAKSILCYDLDGNFIKEYDCIKDASKELNLNSSHIVRVCKKQLNKTGKYKFKYK